MDSSEKMMCPTITVWIVFVVNLVLFYSIFIMGDYRYYRYYRIYYVFQFFLLIINCLIELISSILVTISFEKKKYCLYLSGLIMSLIFDIFMTIFIIMSIIYREILIISDILLILIEWSLFTVLMIYNKRVKSLFNKSYLYPSFLNGFQNEITPQ